MPAPLEAPPSDDASFDLLYPYSVRRKSARFWTPVDVARRAAQLFDQAGSRAVLDVGAGAGKFAIVAAIAAPDIHFVGIEQRHHLVDVARATAARLALSNTDFHQGDATRALWNEFDGVYFFNPFAENLFPERDRMDSHAVLTRDRFLVDVLRTEAALRSTRVGTAVVTYHGMGGRMPTSYELAHSEPARSDRLRLWIKRRATDDGSFFLEMEDRVVRVPARWRAATSGE
jgi:predicted RNA methylase